jgi:muramoyltetrapeptide carboxypeptidase
MRRSAFVAALAGGGGVAASAGCGSGARAVERDVAAREIARATPRPHAGHAIVYAPRLRTGQAVGLVAPAGPLHTADDLTRAQHLVQRLGLRPVVGKHARQRDGYLAGSDDARASDFNAFVRDSSIRAIFAIRGGYGTMRILDLIDYDGLRADPKVIAGFSDLTALLNAVVMRTGIVTFHGPVAGHVLSVSAYDGLRRAVMGTEPLGAMRVPAVGSLSHGAAYGRLVGGNLSMVAALSGTTYAIPCDERILLLEDVKEAPYRVDRMLTQLSLNGDLHVAAGIALGQFKQCVPGPDDDRPSWTIEETLRDRLVPLKKPMITRLNIGHVEDQWTLPLGLPVTFDGDTGVLTVAEPAVR